MPINDPTNPYDRRYINAEGDVMAGPLRVPREPSDDPDAASKSYVDQAIARALAQYVRRDGTLDLTANWNAGPHDISLRLLTALNLVIPDSVKVISLNNIVAGLPGFYARDYADRWQIAGLAVAADRYTLQTPARLSLDVNGEGYIITAQTDIDLSVAANWDAVLPTDYTVAANRAGVDFYIYLCQNATPGGAPTIVLSDNAVTPAGYAAADVRRVGGFHCLCVNVGAIGGHPLTGFLAGDILPDSIWDDSHRPESEPEGMVYSAGAHLWVDIYLASGVGAATASVYNGVISDTRDWMDFVDDGAAVLKRLLNDHEFQIIAALSNEETNIAGGVDPVTAGGHSDTAARRMISGIGCEDCCGATWQWLLDQSYSYDGGGHAHTTTITHKGVPTGSVVQKDQAETNFNGNLGSGANETVNTSNVDPEPPWGWFNLPGARGSLYRQGPFGDVKLLGGGNRAAGADAGSRARQAANGRWATNADLGVRLASEPR